MWTLQEFIKTIVKNGKSKLLKKSEQGLEKESLRTTTEGCLSMSAHPNTLGASLTNPLIKTDFSESQIEFATPYLINSKDLLRYLQNLHSFTHKTLKNEYLWCSSMPCVLPKNHLDIPIADYGNSNQAKLAMKYRMGLTYRYGRKMQTICGIHYNFSYSPYLIAFLRRKFRPSRNSKTFKNACYFHVIRNYLRISWLIDYLFGASSVFDMSYSKRALPNSHKIDNNTVTCKFATSLRMSSIGYTSKVQEKLKISYNNLDSYVRDLKYGAKTEYKPYSNSVKYPIQLNSCFLQREAELYAPIRPKQPPKQDERMINSLRNRGVRYLEFRNIDLNPYSPIGIDENTLNFLYLVGTYCFAKESPQITRAEYKSTVRNRHITAFYGRKSNVKLKYNNALISLQDWALIILEEMKCIAEILDKDNIEKKYEKTRQIQIEKIKFPETTISHRIQTEIKSKKASFAEYILDLSKKYHDKFVSVKLDTKTTKYLKKVDKKSMRDEKKLAEASKKTPFSKYLNRFNRQLIDK